MKVIKYKCEICEKEYDNIPDYSIIFKTTKKVPCYDTIGRINQEVLICPDCQKKIKELVKKDETD